MSPRQLMRGTVAAMLIIVLMFGGVVTWLLTQSPLTLLRQHTSVPAAIRLIPQSATAVVMLKAPFRQVQSLVQALTPPEQRRANRRAWQQLFSAQGPGPIGDLFTLGNLDFSHEVQPWLGDEILLALSQPDPNDSTDNSQLNFLVALSTEDVDQSNATLNLIWQHQDLNQQPLEIETYKGIQIVSTQSEARPTRLVAAAFGDHYVLMANQAAVIRDAIDTWQLPQFSLMNTPGYQSILQALPEAQLGWAYLDLESYQPILQSLGLTFNLNVQGLTLDTVAKWEAPTEAPPNPVKSTAKAKKKKPLFQSLPTTTLAAVTGPQILPDWQRLKQLHSVLGLNPSQWISDLEAGSGLNWEPDLLGWMNRYGFAVLASDTPSSFDWILVAEADPESLAAQSALDQKVATLGLESIPVTLSNESWGEAIAWVKEATLAVPLESAELPQMSELQGIYAQPAPQPIPAQLEGFKDEADPLETESGTPDLERDDPDSLLQELDVLEPLPVEGIAYHLYHEGRFYLTSSLAALEHVLGNRTLKSSSNWQNLNLKRSSAQQAYLFLDLEQIFATVPAEGLDSNAWSHTLQVLRAYGVNLPQTVVVSAAPTLLNSTPGSIQLMY